jgi:hypothetical protein
MRTIATLGLAFAMAAASLAAQEPSSTQKPEQPKSQEPAHDKANATPGKPAQSQQNTNQAQQEKQQKAGDKSSTNPQKQSKDSTKKPKAPHPQPQPQAPIQQTSRGQQVSA